MNNGPVNVRLLIGENAPERIREIVEEREKLIRRVRELSLEKALLEAHQLLEDNISPEGGSDAAGAG